MGEHRKAAKALEQFLAVGGQTSAEICRLLGLISAERDDYQRAIEFLSDALELEPNDSTTLAERGSFYIAIGARDLAEDDFDAALAVDSEQRQRPCRAGTDPCRAARRGPGRRGRRVGLPLRSRDAADRLDGGADVCRFVRATLARGSFVSLEESRNMGRYRRRAVELLDQSLALTPAAERASFWRVAIQSDPWLRLLSEHSPRYRELSESVRAAAGRAWGWVMKHQELQR